MSFREILRSSGVETVKLPARSPNLNAYAERFVRSIKSECLAQIIPLGEQHRRHAVKEYTEHYHIERNHQGLDNRLIEDRCSVADLLDSPPAPSRLDGGLSRHGLLPIREPGLDCELAGRKLAAPLDGGHQLAETMRVEAPRGFLAIKRAKL